MKTIKLINRKTKKIVYQKDLDKIASINTTYKNIVIEYHNGLKEMYYKSFINMVIEQKGGKGMKTKEQLFEEYCEHNFNKYFDYYITETDTMTALKKSFENNWSFSDCKKYF